MSIVCECLFHYVTLPWHLTQEVMYHISSFHCSY
jgi:hypothetical protein